METMQQKLAIAQKKVEEEIQKLIFDEEVEYLAKQNAQEKNIGEEEKKVAAKFLHEKFVSEEAQMIVNKINRDRLAK